MQLFVGAVIVAFIFTSAIADKGGTAYGVVVGIVTALNVGDSITVAPKHIHSRLFHAALRRGVACEDRDGLAIDCSDVANGARVMVWYRRPLGDVMAVIEKVRVLARGSDR